MKSSQCRVGSTAGASRHPILGGCGVLGKIQTRISESKHGFCGFFGQIQKRIMNPWNPHSGWILRIKSKFEFLRLAIWAFLGERIWKQYFCQAVFRTKMVHNRFRNMYDILTEPIYVAGAWAISYISFRVSYLFTFADSFEILTCHVFCTYVVSAYACLFSDISVQGPVA